MHARIQIYWCRSSIFRHLKLELLTQFPASNDEKYINVVYIWRKFVSFYGYVHWRMTTEISVMYGSEKVKNISIEQIICNRRDWFNIIISAGRIVADAGSVFSYKLRYSVGFWLVEMAISTNQKPTIYRNLYENTAPGSEERWGRPWLFLSI